MSQEVFICKPLGDLSLDILVATALIISPCGFAASPLTTEVRSVNSGQTTVTSKPQAKNHDVTYYIDQLKKTPKSEDSTDGLEPIGKIVSGTYVELEGEFDGYIVFKLFKGKAQDIILRQITGCGPECEQTSIRALIFTNGELTATKDFEVLYPAQAVADRVRMKKQRLAASVKSKNWLPWFAINKEHDEILVLLIDGNPGLKGHKIHVAEVGKLVWGGEKFDFSPSEVEKMRTIRSDSIR